jgi:hypothetical protein
LSRLTATVADTVTTTAKQVGAKIDEAKPAEMFAGASKTVADSAVSGWSTVSSYWDKAKESVMTLADNNSGSSSNGSNGSNGKGKPSGNDNGDDQVGQPAVAAKSSTACRRAHRASRRPRRRLPQRLRASWPRPNPRQRLRLTTILLRSCALRRPRPRRCRRSELRAKAPSNRSRSPSRRKRDRDWRRPRMMAIFSKDLAATAATTTSNRPRATTTTTTTTVQRPMMVVRIGIGDESENQLIRWISNYSFCNKQAFAFTNEIVCDSCSFSASL